MKTAIIMKKCALKWFRIHFIVEICKRIDYCANTFRVFFVNFLWKGGGGYE